MEVASTQKQQLNYNYSKILKQIEKTQIVQKYKEKQKELQEENLQQSELNKKLELLQKKYKDYSQKEHELMKLRERNSELHKELNGFNTDESFESIIKKCTEHEVSYRENQVSFIMTELSNKLFSHLLEVTTFINQCLISEVIKTSYTQFNPITDELYLFYLFYLSRYNNIEPIQQIHYYVISSIVKEEVEIPEKYKQITSILVELLLLTVDQRRNKFQELHITYPDPLYCLLLTTDKMDLYFENLCKENEIPTHIYNQIKKNVFNLLNTEVSNRLNNFTNFI